MLASRFYSWRKFNGNWIKKTQLSHTHTHTYTQIHLNHCLPNALSLDPELSDAIPSGLCVSRIGLVGVGGVRGVSGDSICIWSVICIVFVVRLLKTDKKKIQKNMKRKEKCQIRK